MRDRWCDGLAVEQALRTREDGQPNPDYEDWGRGTRPVVGVSWYDAQAFVGWLNWKTGEDDAYRLPSEAEWEYAARAGTTTAYPWGTKLDHNYGNFGIAGPGLGGKAEGRDVWVDQTAPVASFPPNAFGLYDMHGNVFEWVEDCYEADRAHAPADGSANKQGNCANRVFRDGTFLSNPYMQRSAQARRAVSGDTPRTELPGLPGRQDPRLKESCMRVPAIALIGLCVTAGPAAAQPFANAKSSRAAYTSPTLTPRKACESLATFKGEGIAHDAGARRARHGRCAATLPRERRAGAGDRLRGQPADAVERPLLHDRQRRPRRRGARRSAAARRSATEALAHRLRHGADQHRPRRAQGAGRHRSC